MKKYVIGIGGTGIRCVESLIYLLSAGLGGDKEVNIIIIDFDINNKNLSNLKEVIDCYKKNNSYLRNCQVFKTKINTVEDENINFARDLPSDISFGDFLEYSNVELSRQRIYKIFFTQPEIDMKLMGGFRAHSGVGEVVMNRLKDNEEWEKLVEKIRSPVPSDEVRVFVFASIFGGTGSSGFPFVGSSLRKSINEAEIPNKKNLKLGGALLLPYFTFLPTDEEELYARPEHFPVNTYSALQYYNLVWGNKKKSCPYDAIYFMGYDNLQEVEFAIYGEQQENPLHIINLLASLSALDFFQRDDIAQRDESGNIRENSPPPFFYAGYDGEEGITWDSLPLEGLRDKLLYFTCFGISYLDFFFPLINMEDFEEKSYVIPWYHDFFIKRGVRLTSARNKEKLEDLKTFFEKFYFPFLKDILNDNNVRLFRKGLFDEKDDGKRGDIGMLLEDRNIKDSNDKLWRLTLLQEEPEGEDVDKFVNLLYGCAQKFIDEFYFLKR